MPSDELCIVETLPTRLDGLKVVLDCANGAAFRVAPEAFRRAVQDAPAETSRIRDALSRPAEPPKPVRPMEPGPRLRPAPKSATVIVSRLSRRTVRPRDRRPRGPQNPARVKAP